MKKIYFLAAACAAMSMASCSTETLDETVLQSDSNLISFNVNAGKSTKADITTGNIQKFNATAIINGGSTQYFDNVEYAKNNQTFNSANPYYWPESEALDFYAYAPVPAEVPAGGKLTRTDYKTFDVTVPSTYAKGNTTDYLDLVFANTNGKSKKGTYKESTFGAYGVPINFRHAESKIVVKVKNSAANLKFVITDWKLGFLDDSGKFIYADEDTDGNNGGQLPVGNWSGNEDANVGVSYTQQSSITVEGGATNSQLLDGEMILIPQTTHMATQYVNGTTEDLPDNQVKNGSYIGFQFQILNNDSDTPIFSNVNNEWAIWPVAFEWNPGYKYVYTVDLAGGGYYETNHNDINEGTNDLDPILGEDAIIKFVDVTVDEWTSTTPEEQPVKMLLSNALERAANFKLMSNGEILYSGDSLKTVTMPNVKTSDFQWPSYKGDGTDDPATAEDVNDNNVYKDLTTFFNGLNFAGSPVAAVIYNDTEYTWDGSDWRNGKTVQNAIAANIFSAKFWDSEAKTFKAGNSGMVEILLKGNAQDAPTEAKTMKATLSLTATSTIQDDFVAAMKVQPTMLPNATFSRTKNSLDLSDVNAKQDFSFDSHNNVAMNLKAIFAKLTADKFSKITFAGKEFTWSPNDGDGHGNWTTPYEGGGLSALQNEITTSFLADELTFGPTETADITLYNEGGESLSVKLTVTADEQIQFDENGWIIDLSDAFDKAMEEIESQALLSNGGAAKYVRDSNALTLAVKGATDFGFGDYNVTKDLRALFRKLILNTEKGTPAFQKILFGGKEFTWTPNDGDGQGNWTTLWQGGPALSALQSEITTSFLADELKFGKTETATITLVNGNQKYDVTITVTSDKQICFNNAGEIIKIND